MSVEYAEFGPVTKPHNRAFETAIHAFRLGDANPLRLYLDLPLKGLCDDCMEESVMVPHGKDLLCPDCCDARDKFLASIYGG